jgi:D-sedoheptulose 7-phosphate isomerase
MLAPFPCLADNEPRMNADDIRRLVAESVALKERFFEEATDTILDVARALSLTLRDGGRVLAFGNGGSAADAQHLAAELVGRFRRERPGLAALALGADPSVVTSLGNDFGFESVFRRQVEAHGRPGDVAIGFTTSGRSANVVEALQAARSRGLVTVGLTGEGGGDLAGLVHHLLAVPHTDTARVQEVHGMVVHVLCQHVDEGEGS